MELQLGYEYIVNIDIDKLHPGYPGIRQWAVSNGEFYAARPKLQFSFDAASIYWELHAALTAFAKGVCVLVGGRGSAKLATALLVRS